MVRLLWSRGVAMIAERIKLLREQHGLTQAALSKRLGITRASVNAWEMGLSVPSTQYLVELSQIFGVSTDYLLGLNRHCTIDVSGLFEKEVTALVSLVSCLKAGKASKE